jgi:glycogen phosphorylase
MATTEKLPSRERRPSTSAPIVDIQGAVGPAGISRPKHKRTATGFGPGEIKNIEGKLQKRNCVETAADPGFPA